MNDDDARTPGITRKSLLRAALVVPAVPLLAGMPALASTPSGQPPRAGSRCPPSCPASTRAGPGTSTSRCRRQAARC
jgi:hypothetical protein